jgi:DNA primase small subunit
MKVLQRELVFDIDMDDYSEVRRCCDNGKAKRLCSRCWPFLHIAIQVIRKGLKELFGFEKVVFIFSGRRGIHCWVSDHRARLLTSRARQAILDFLIVPVVVSKEKLSAQPFFSDLHPFMREVYTDILEPCFEEDILVQQGLLDDEEGQTLILRFVPDSDILLFSPSLPKVSE